MSKCKAQVLGGKNNDGKRERPITGYAPQRHLPTVYKNCGQPAAAHFVNRLNGKEIDFCQAHIDSMSRIGLTAWNYADSGLSLGGRKV